MRIDLPGCDLKTCRYCQDHNCTDKNRYETCNYARLKDGEYTANWEGLTNIQKLCRIFPHAASSGMATLICPAALYGYNMCPFDKKTEKDVWDYYDAKSDRCRQCARTFWKWLYDGAENLDEQRRNMKETLK